MCVLYGVVAWTTYVLLIGAILGFARFDMAFITYLLGIPIIIALLLTLKNSGQNVLLVPLHKQQKGEDALYQVNQLLYLIQTKD